MDIYIEIPGNEIIFHNRENSSRYRSGGIAEFGAVYQYRFTKLKQTCVAFYSLKTHLRFKYKTNDDMTNDDLFCGVVYIPP